MIFRILSKQGSIIDVDTPEGFNFSAAAISIKLNGYFQNDRIFIDYDNIAFMAFGDTMPTIQNAPTVETKQ